MGRKLVLNGTKLTDTTAPRLITIDPIESSGSLLLVDLTHPSAPLAAGLPATNTTVPNVLADFASALGITAAPVFRSEGFTGSAGLIERTGRGGIHGIPSPTVATTAVKSDINFRDMLGAYLLANSTHAYYMSTWSRTTRLPNGATRTHANISNISGAASSYLLRHNHGQVSPAGRTGSTGTSPSLQTNSTAAWTGTMPTATSSLSATTMFHGNSPFAYTDDLVRKSGAGIYYRFYLEDLTVSGRAYSQVDGIDNDLFNKEVLTVGGRYYGDTFTDPATIA